MTADIFWRAFNRNKEKMLSDENVRSVRVEVESGADLGRILEEGERVTGVRLRARRDKGPFEVQTDEGCWYNQGRALWGSPTTQFKTWEEMEAEEA